MQIINLCNPENRRAAFFRQACDRFGLAPPLEIAWQDLLNDPFRLDPDAVDGIRIESPGENFEVEKKLIERGGGPRDLEYDHGRLRFQPEWYRGWKGILSQLAEIIGETPVMNAPEEIALMFDKWRSQQRLAAAGVPIPELLGKIESFAALEALMDESGANRVFLKPCHSSSASGVVALQRSVRFGRYLATTSAEWVRDGNRLYNSLQLRHYQDRGSVGELVDALAQQDLMAERWFPKASFEGRVFDLRVLVIAGRARHVVVRSSVSPITNLHLGNRRGDLEAVRERLGESVWSEGMRICEKAAGCFPRSHYVAVDLMPASSMTSYAVAEVNAFGDLIPGILSQGDDTYTAELRALRESGNGSLKRPRDLSE